MERPHEPAEFGKKNGVRGCAAMQMQCDATAGHWSRIVKRGHYQPVGWCFVSCRIIFHGSRVSLREDNIPGSRLALTDKSSPRWLVGGAEGRGLCKKLLMWLPLERLQCKKKKKKCKWRRNDIFMNRTWLSGPRKWQWVNVLCRHIGKMVPWNLITPQNCRLEKYAVNFCLFRLCFFANSLSGFDRNCPKFRINFTLKAEHYKVQGVEQNASMSAETRSHKKKWGTDFS